MHPRRATSEASAALALLLVALVLGRPLVSQGYLFPDSYAYMEWPADFVLAGGTRVMGARPIGYALFLDVFGTGAALVWAQTVLSFASWSALGWLAGRLPGVLVGCAIALAPPVWRWNASVLTESSSLSLVALSLGVSLAWARRAAAGAATSWRTWAAWTACALFLGWSRDANLALLPALLLPAAYVRARERIALVAVVLAVGVLGALDARRNERADWSLENAVLARVLPDPAALLEFEAAGMPVSGALRDAAGSPGRRTQGRLREAAPEFDDWVRSSGARVYWSWVLSRRSSGAEAWRALDEYNGLDLVKYPPEQEIPRAVGAAQSVWALGPPPWMALFLPLLLVPALRRERRVRPELLGALLAAATALVYSFLSYHADGVEAHRHMLPGIVLLRAAMWLGLAALFTLFQARTASDARAPEPRI